MREECLSHLLLSLAPNCLLFTLLRVANSQVESAYVNELERQKREVPTDQCMVPIDGLYLKREEDRYSLANMMGYTETHTHKYVFKFSYNFFH